ncbi:phage major capsid protein, HK97 family [Halomonas shengliensis]|uniref:Phage major capsid protein, HK97 family n=1 Tax=Halomonas shengliensis TaxID=419597 RepID=A0A1H0IEX6_9GAMM|nr:phage major capsid protein [Halomonas shengliensis]SDO29621.1 phage major capsid protein, HK97 family [Halomonas shengliensis]
MAVDQKDVAQVAEELGKRFDEFKSTNDKRLEAVEQEKSALSEKTEAMNAKLSELDQLKADLEASLKEANRPDKPGGKKEVTEHKAAFESFIRKGREDGLRELEQKALNTTTDADGGYAVPEELDRNILELLKDESPMRQVCSQITVSTPDYKKLVNLGGAGSGWVGEAAARPATDTPTLAQIAAIMGEIYANPQATQTSLDDVFFDAEAWLNAEVAREFAEQEGAAFLNGDGTNKPKGILSYAFDTAGDASRAFGTLQKIHSGTAGDFVPDDLIKLVYNLKKGYRAGATWMLPMLTLFKVRTMKDDQGNYLWRPGIEAGEPSSLLGYAVTENEDMPAVAADANAVLFGDFRRAYTIVDRIGTRVLRDPFTNKPNVGFYTTKRVGGMLTDSQAVKALTLSI